MTEPSPLVPALEANDAWESAYRAQASSSLWQDEPIEFVHEAVDFLRAREARTVIDIGCGDGRNLPPLARAGLTVTGVDVSATALARACDRMRGQDLESFAVMADVVSMPFATGTVDAATCLDVFSHFVDPIAALAEIRRVLRPGGQFAVNVFSTDDSEVGKGDHLGGTSYRYRGTFFRFYAEEELRALLADWEIVELRQFSWWDPPHGEFRPYPHKHSSFLVKVVAG